MSDLQELKQKLIKYNQEKFDKYKSLSESERNLLIDENINLEDVLIALSKQYGEWHCTFWGNNICHIDKGIIWILGKPLHEQSEEIITALNKIII